MAVLQIDANNIEDIGLGDSDNIRVGEWVMAVGSPFSEILSKKVIFRIYSRPNIENVSCDVS